MSHNPPSPAASYYRARYYDPQAGRFLSEDRLGFQGGADFYRYARNSPLMWNDPSGNIPQSTGYSPAPDLCFSVTSTGTTQEPCADPNGGWTCIDVPTGQSCVIHMNSGPPSARPVDRSLEILDKLDQCLWQEIEEDKKIETDLLNSTFIWNLGVGGGSLGSQGLEAGLEYFGLHTAAKWVPLADLGLLGYHLVEGVKTNIEATRRLNEAKQRACSCEQQALNK